MARTLATVALGCLSALVGAAWTTNEGERPARWRISISAVQTQHFEIASQFNPIDTCTLRYTGDQTIRVSTPGPVAVDLVPQGAAYQAFGYIQGKRRNFVPLVGAERRVYHVQEAPAPSACDDPRARVYGKDCSATEPLVKGTGTFVFITMPRTPRVGWHVPVQFGFQPTRRFARCARDEFELWNLFVYPLFTYGDSAPLRGGHLDDPQVRRLGGHGGATVCMREGYPREEVRFISCMRPHASKFVVDWTITFTR